MNSFVDETVIEVSSGRGGDGAVSFRREKYVPKGGPDGGDGGDGGDVYFITKKNLKTLSHLKMRKNFKAENGGPGRKKKQYGKRGRDIEIEVPPGTLLRDPETSEIIKDLADENYRWKYVAGGRGGKGNSHFANSVRQAPRTAQKGKEGITTRIKVELQLIADVGFVGFPNAGKSTLLRALTNAHPKIGDYAFTTIIPNLGVLKIGYHDLVIADIPGLIRGAHEGAGLGTTFLRHISRTKGLAFLIDLTNSQGIEQYPILLDELGSYKRELLWKKRIIICTKTDAEGTETVLKQIRERYPDEIVVGVSSFTKQGLDELKGRMLEIVQN